MPDSNDLKHVTIFTDGACRGNPGPGGYGIILVHAEKRREISGGFRLTTNNRMELLAAIVALETLRFRCNVTLHTDSEYIYNAVTKGWLKGWKAKGWRKADGKPVANVDLWSRFILAQDRHDLTLSWVRGHAGHPENERCDKLAVEASHRDDLPDDDGYP